MFVELGVIVIVAAPLFPVPVPPPVTDTIVYVEVVVGFTGMLTGLPVSYTHLTLPRRG